MLNWPIHRRILLIITICLSVVILPNVVAGQTISWADIGSTTEYINLVLDDIPPGQWYEVPDSKLEPFLPNPIPPNWSGPGAIMGSWNGGAYDTKRDRLIIWGGGHNDYGGNEIYTFDLPSQSWARTWGPSPNIPEAGGECYETYSDGNPASRHTYDGLAYIPGKDWFWSNGGYTFCGAGGTTFTTWIFDFQDMTWRRKSDVPTTGYSTGVVSSAYDPVTGHVFHQGTRTFTEYDPNTDSWTVRGEVPEGHWEATTAAIDPVNRLLVDIGGGGMLAWNLETSQRIDPVTTGGSNIVNAQAPGFVYDPVGKQFIGWAGGSDLYRLDVSQWTWTKLPVDPGNSVTPTNPQSTGTYGRFQYVPSLHALILINSIYENVYIFKLPEPGFLGDLNLDGKVDAVDLQLCIDVFLGTEKDPGFPRRADLNSDGRVNAIDVQLIANIALGN